MYRLAVFRKYMEIREHHNKLFQPNTNRLQKKQLLLLTVEESVCSIQYSQLQKKKLSYKLSKAERTVVVVVFPRFSSFFLFFPSVDEQ